MFRLNRKNIKLKKSYHLNFLKKKVILPKNKKV